MNQVDRFGIETVDAIGHLVRANHYTQALILLYSAIDALAWVSLSSGDVTGTDFRRWVRDYMDPETSVGCSPEALYAARCGLLHSGTSESKMSREGKAPELWYVTSPFSVTQLDAHRQRIGSQSRVVYFTALLAAFAEGAMCFADDLAADPQRHAAADLRMQLWLRFVRVGKLNEDDD